MGGFLAPLVVRYEPEENRELELETVFLDEETTPGSQATFVSTATPKPASDLATPPPPQLVPTPLDPIDLPKDHLSGIKDLMAPVGEGTTASAQAVVDNYGQAHGSHHAGASSTVGEREPAFDMVFRPVGKHEGRPAGDSRPARANLHRTGHDRALRRATVW